MSPPAPLEPAVAVMARVPGAGPVKSRLQSVLTPAETSALYRCFLLDRLDALATVLGIARMVAFTPPEAHAGGFLQVSGLRMSFDPARPAGQRVLAVEIGGAPLDPERRYTAAIVDYIARGGDGFTAFRDTRVLVDAASGPLLADVLLQAVTERGTIAPDVDGRLRAIR